MNVKICLCITFIRVDQSLRCRFNYLQTTEEFQGVTKQIPCIFKL